MLDRGQRAVDDDEPDIPRRLEPRLDLVDLAGTEQRCRPPLRQPDDLCFDDLDRYGGSETDGLVEGASFGTQPGRVTDVDGLENEGPRDGGDRCLPALRGFGSW